MMPGAMRIVIGVGVVVVIALLAFFILSNTPAFTISSIEAEASEHVNAETIGKLAKVPEGTTLLNVDTGQIAENVKKNPWVASVNVVREFPDKIKIVVTERKVRAIVLMSSGDIAWYLGEDGCWIEPFKVDVTSGTTAQQVAAAKATELGCLLITDVPSTVSPAAGSVATDESLSAVDQYTQGFSNALSSQIVSYSASSTESVSCTLSTGVVVSLGSPTSIDSKETVITQLLAEYPGQLTYINVRVPTKPTYRKVGTDSVGAGSVYASTTSTSATSATSVAATTSEG